MIGAGGASARAAASIYGGKERNCSAQVPAAAGGSPATSDLYPAAGCACGPVGYPRGCPGIHPGALCKERGHLVSALAWLFIVRVIALHGARKSRILLWDIAPFAE